MLKTFLMEYTNKQLKLNFSTYLLIIFHTRSFCLKQTIKKTFKPNCIAGLLLCVRWRSAYPANYKQKCRRYCHGRKDI